MEELFYQVIILALIVWAFVATVLSIIFYKKWIKRQKSAFKLGESKIKWDLGQIFGTFSLLKEYDQLILLSMTSSQCSLDLLGVKEDELDFIEIKYKGLSLGKEERKIKQLFDEKKVKYVVWDIELPEDIKLTKRNSLLEFFVYNFLTTLGLNSTIVSTIILYY